jgi:transposase-like protein
MGIERKKVRGGKQKYSAAFKRQVALDYLGGTATQEQVALRYNLLNKWVVKDFLKWYRLEGEEPSREMVLVSEAADLECLRRELADVRGQLELERMKSLALNTAIDIAEVELGVDIRKKSVSKQSRP